MPQIYIMAAITLATSLMLWGGLTYLFTGRQRRYFWLLILGLPLSAVVNLIIKPQAIAAIGQATHVQAGLGLAAPIWFLAFKVLVTPLVEEPVKALPLLLRPAWKLVTNQASALWVGFILGVSFGLGEAAFIAYAVAQNDAYNSLPWYAFTGFLNERIMTCFAHGVLTAVLVLGLQRRGRYLLFGTLTAIGLHLFLNTPTVMYQFQWISYEVYNFSIVIPLIGLAVIFERMRRATRGLRDDQSSKEIVYWQWQDIKRHGRGSTDM
jgi:RsiW-degrading membrane proteinase PrsW (M82 family)